MAKYQRGILTTILIVVCMSYVLNANCPPGWKSWRDSCYILLAGRLRWGDASRACGLLRSRLFTPNSLEENDFVHVDIQKDIKDNNNCPCSLWLGCRNQGEKVVCGDQSKQPDFIDHVWAPAQYHYSGECVIMSLSLKGKWQSLSCKRSSQFVVCEMKHQQPYIYTLVAGNDGRFTSQCLRDHEIRSVPAKGVIECGEACWAEPLCRSFNLWQGSQREVCQLNNATHLESGERNVISDNDCTYFEL